MNKKVNILLTSVGRRSYLAQFFKNALGDRGKVMGSNSHGSAVGMSVVDEAFVVPQANEPGFIPKMLEICQKHEVTLLLSLHDFEAPYLVEARADFERVGTRLVMASDEFINICFDKYETFNFCQRHGFDTCATFVDRVEFEKALDAGEMTMPLVLKPRWGFGSVGLFFVDEARLVPPAIEMLKGELKKTVIPQLSEFSEDTSILFQQMLIGVEYGVDIVNDLEGRFVTCFIERKYSMRAGETDIAEVVEDQAIFELGERIGQVSKHPGVLDIDVIVMDGRPYVLEMNPRFGGHYPFAHYSGADVPAAIIAWANNEDVKPEWLTASAGIKIYKDYQFYLDS